MTEQHTNAASMPPTETNRQMAPAPLDPGRPSSTRPSDQADAMYSSDTMQAELSALAVNVQRLRESHGLSLTQLAERSGVAKATLYKVEREQTNPTLETLVAIASTFSVEVTELLSPLARPGVEVYHMEGGEDISDDASAGFVLRSQAIGAGILEIHVQTFRHGHSETSISHGIGSREHVFVHSGSLRLGPVGEEVDVTAGDYVTYAADRPHRWTVIGSTDAQVWIVHSFPRPLSSAAD
jgi:transcriptional regulator with XRE-family HTH domain